jgi:hypothetical protein
MSLIFCVIGQPPPPSRATYSVVHDSCRGVECEEIAASARLIAFARYRLRPEMAEQQSADAAMPDEQDITLARFGQHGLDLDARILLCASRRARSQPRMLSVGEAKNASAIASNSGGGR